MEFFKINLRLVMIFFLISLLILEIKADNINESAGQVLDGLKGAWDGASGMVSGMAQSFGYVPSDYTYNLCAWNDSPGMVGVVKQEVTKVLGAGFSGPVTRYAKLLPYTNTGDWMKEQLYFTLWLLIEKDNVDYNEYKTKIDDYALMGTAFPGLGNAIMAFAGSIVTTEALEKYELLSKNISQKDLENVYHYRAYTDKGVIKGEYLGAKTTTQEFSGVFYNGSSSSDISLQFIKDGITYKVALEAGTFSLLNSTSGNPTSIRPGKAETRGFTFYQGSTILAAMPIHEKGICNLQLDPATNKLIPGSAMVYTYEVYSGKKGPAIGMQGLAIGNFRQPLDQDPKKNVVRDVNPMECHAWYQSAQQAQKEVEETAKPTDAKQLFHDFTEQVWIFYKTKDYSYSKKINAGDVIDFTLIRPRISEKSTWLYVVALETDDDKKALNFLNRLNDGKIGEKIKEPISSIGKFDESTVLTTMQSNTHGVIDDTKGTGSSGIKGYVLLADNALPRGVGTGPFYYQIRPPVVDIGQLVDLFSSNLDEKRFANGAGSTNELTTKIEKWILLYPKNNKQIITEVTTYLQEKGADSLMIDPKASTRTLNNEGKKAVDIIVSGPVSIAHYPRQQQAGSNGYVYTLGDVPKGWPSK